MPNIWQTVPDSQTITIKNMRGFGEKYALKNGNTINLKMVDLQPLLTFNMCNI